MKSDLDVERLAAELDERTMRVRSAAGLARVELGRWAASPAGLATGLAAGAVVGWRLARSPQPEDASSGDADEHPSKTKKKAGFLGLVGGALGGMVRQELVRRIRQALAAGGNPMHADAADDADGVLAWPPGAVFSHPTATGAPSGTWHRPAEPG